ncbi:MAG: hypothetical protein CMJ81_01090 [Planctomycetaceae bacterium]|nr:hypothetical protein [Planctomycetaceae bacterium]
MAESEKEALANLNLLFGVLALKMDFIDQDQLVQSMNAWVLEKSRSLSDILVEQGTLSKSRVAVLEALIEEHLKEHQNDPERSLGAVTSVTMSLQDVRQALGNMGDADIQQSLTGVTAAFEPQMASEDATQTQGDPSGAQAAASQRFRVLRPHAKGGLGQVSVAQDQELNREVALKEIQPRFADDQMSRGRFLLEAEITGGLEHPGIVPVYGLGSYRDGRPYYAMRFIRGDDFKSAIRRYYEGVEAKKSPGELTLDFRKLLRRFVDVCFAMEYAHSRRVLHRDIKPGNIMLGKYGETMVVDWGMAKLLDTGEGESGVDFDHAPIALSTSRDVVATSMGSTVGTPPYMSPEQAAGRLDQLGPGSDVYSLGATLYHFLTGQAPFRDRDIGSVLNRVKQGDFEPPRKLVPSVPKPLEAICLKAMARKPDDRYRSAGALAEDIEHWLADEPVSALQESLFQRTARWLRRHKTWTQAIAVSLVLITLVSAIAVVLVSNSLKKEQIAKEEAQTQRDFAFRRFQETRNAINEWVIGGADAFDQHWLFQDYRREFLEKAVKALEVLAEQRLDVEGVQIDRGRVFKDLGNLHRLAGHFDESRQKYQEAIRIFEKHPDSVEAQLELAQVHTQRGLFFAEKNERDQAESSYQIAIDILEPRVTEDLEQTALAVTLGETLLNLGNLYRDNGDYSSATDALQRSVDLLDRLTTGQSAGRYVIALSKASLALGKTVYDQGHPQKALQLYDRSIEHCAQLLQTTVSETREKEFENLDTREVLAAASMLRASLLGKLGKYKEQFEAYDLALRSFEQLSATRRHERRYHDSTVGTRYNRAMAFYRIGETSKAEADLRQALEHFQRLESIFEVDVYVEHKATAIDDTGRVFSDQGKDPEAAQVHRRAIEFLSVLAQENPEVFRYRERLAVSRSNLGRVLHKLDEDLEAVEQFSEAVKSLEEIVEQKPEVHRIHDELATVYQHLSLLYFDRGEKEPGRLAFEKARRNWELVTSSENVASINYLNNLALLLLHCPVPELRDIRLAKESAQRAIRVAPENSFYCTSLGIAEYREGNWTQAVEWLQKAVQLQSGQAMAPEQFFLAMTLWQQSAGPNDEADQYFDAAVEWMQSHRPGNRQLQRIYEEAKQLRETRKTSPGT